MDELAARGDVVAVGYGVTCLLGTQLVSISQRAVVATLPVGRHLTLSPEGDRLAMVTSESVTVWSVPDAKPLGTRKGIEDVKGLSLLADGRLVGVGAKGEIGVWAADGGFKSVAPGVAARTLRGLRRGGLASWRPRRPRLLRPGRDLVGRDRQTPALVPDDPRLARPGRVRTAWKLHGSLGGGGGRR